MLVLMLMLRLKFLWGLEDWHEDGCTSILHVNYTLHAVGLRI